MRHFAGVLLGIVLLPVFFALNWLVNLADAKAASPSRWWLLAALGAYALVGLVAGICLAWRKLSPTALLLGGVLILAVEVLLNLPALAGMQVDVPQLYAHLPITGGRLLVAVGVALFFGGLLPTRWHRPVPRDADTGVADGSGHGDGGDYDHDDSAYTTELLGRPAGYETWGSGRNEYAEEPEESYTAALPATGGHDERSHGGDADRAYGVDAYDDRTGYGERAAADPTRPTPIASHQPLPAQPVASAPDEPTQRVESPGTAAQPVQQQPVQQQPVQQQPVQQQPVQQQPVQQQPVQQQPVQQPHQVPAVPAEPPSAEPPSTAPPSTPPAVGHPDGGYSGSTFPGSAGSGYGEPAYAEPDYAEPDDGPTRPDEQFENGGHSSTR